MASSPRAADSQQRILRRTLLTTREIWQTCLPDDLVVFILKFLSFEQIWTQCLRVSRRMWWLCCQRQSQLFATIRRPFTEFGRQEDYRLVFLLEIVGEHIVTLAIEATFSGTTADFSESLALEENCQRLKHFIAPNTILTPQAIQFLQQQLALQTLECSLVLPKSCQSLDQPPAGKLSWMERQIDDTFSSLNAIKRVRLRHLHVDLDADEWSTSTIQSILKDLELWLDLPDVPGPHPNGDYSAFDFRLIELTIEITGAQFDHRDHAFQFALSNESVTSMLEVVSFNNLSLCNNSVQRSIETLKDCSTLRVLEICVNDADDIMRLWSTLHQTHIAELMLTGPQENSTANHMAIQQCLQRTSQLKTLTIVDNELSGEVVATIMQNALYNLQELTLMSEDTWFENEIEANTMSIICDAVQQVCTTSSTCPPPLHPVISHSDGVVTSSVCFVCLICLFHRRNVALGWSIWTCDLPLSIKLALIACLLQFLQLILKIANCGR